MKTINNFVHVRKQKIKKNYPALNKWSAGTTNIYFLPSNEQIKHLSSQCKMINLNASKNVRK